MYIKKINIQKPVKLICSLLFTSQELLIKTENTLSEEFGLIDLHSDLIPFDMTDYYVDELGKNILRKYISFEKLIDIVKLPDIKIWTNKIEIDLENKETDKRRVNIDPGYLTLSKMVLATTKNYSHRIYLRDGIYAEVTLHYQNKSFIPWEWTYPDYKLKKTIAFFTNVRAIYKEQLKTV